MSNAKPNEKSVLIVDEEAMIRQPLAERFRTYPQLEVLEATSTREAFNFLTESLPDILVLDLELPSNEEDERELSSGSTSARPPLMGVELLDRLRSGQFGEGGTTLWVAVITGHGERSMINRVRGLIDDRGRLFLKPFDDQRLELLSCMELGISCNLPEVLQDLIREELAEGSR